MGERSPKKRKKDHAEVEFQLKILCAALQVAVYLSEVAHAWLYR